MSSAKDTFEANTWEANSFAAGAFRGVGVTVITILGSQWVAGQSYVPGFKEGDSYNPGFKEGESYQPGFKEGQVLP